MAAATEVPDVPDVPLSVRLEMAHASLQWVADAENIRLLHIKGSAIDDRLRWPGRQGSDADVLVPARDAAALVDALQRHDWTLTSEFRHGSSFEHAAALRHEQFGWADVHRYYPGFGGDPDEMFDRLWADRGSIRLADVACAVPSVPAQALVLLLHAARSPGSGSAERDIDIAWHSADPELRAQVEELVDRLDAEVGFAAAVGDLDAYRDRPEYELWRVAARGGSRLDEWRARIKAAPTWRSRVSVVLRAPLVNTEHLAMVLWRRPTRLEVVREFFARPYRGVLDEVRTRAGPRRDRRRGTGPDDG
jgi:hypothetical protein